MQPFQRRRSVYSSFALPPSGDDDDAGPCLRFLLFLNADARPEEKDRREYEATCPATSVVHPLLFEDSVEGFDKAVAEDDKGEEQEEEEEEEGEPSVLILNLIFKFIPF